MSHSAFFTLTNQKRQLLVISMGLFNDEIHTIAGQGERGPPGIGLTLTSNGDFDIKEKRLTAVGSPKEASDSPTKGYVDHNDMYRSIHTKNEFLLAASDFSKDGTFLVFVFGKYPHYSRKYHNTHSHVACSVSRFSWTGHCEPRKTRSRGLWPTYRSNHLSKRRFREFRPGG